MKMNLFDGFGIDQTFSELHNDLPRLINVGGGKVVPSIALTMLMSQSGLTRHDIEGILGREIPDVSDITNEDKQTLLIELTKRLS